MNSRRHHLPFLTLLVSCLVPGTVLMPACGGDDESGKPTVTADAGSHGLTDAGTADAGHTPTIITDKPDAGGTDLPDAWTPVVPPTSEDASIVWLHTALELYKGDLAVQPFTYELVGTFTCPKYEELTGSPLKSVNDLAVDKDGNLFAVAAKAAMPVTVEGTSVKCTDVWAFPEGTASFMGLTFAPAGTLDAENEVLVGADNSGKLWRIDETDGHTVQIGTFGTIPETDGHGNAFLADYVGKEFKLSGDIVFMSNEGNPVGFATVIECKDYKKCKGDTLVEIDLAKLRDGNTGSVVKSIRGKVVKSASCSDTEHDTYGSMYGIAAYEAQIYGFSYAGEIVELSNADGTACLIQSDAEKKFYGAGITTAAKVEIHFN